MSFDDITLNVVMSIVMLKISVKNVSKEIFLRPAHLLVGRANESGLIIVSDSVSRKHCRLWHENESWWVEDLGSTNGTWLNGVRGDGAPLEITKPSILEIGWVRLEVEPWDPEDVLPDDVSHPPVVIKIDERTHKLSEEERQNLQTQVDFFHCIMEMHRPEDFYRSEIPAYLERCGIKGFGVVASIRGVPAMRFSHGQPPDSWLWRQDILGQGFSESFHLQSEQVNQSWFSFPFRVHREKAFMYLICLENEAHGHLTEGLRRRLMELARFLFMITGTPIQTREEEALEPDQDNGIVHIPGHSSPVLLASPTSMRMLREIRDLSHTDSGVILEGETGVGKEIVAAMIHHFSDRKGPFMPIMTSSLSEQLVENELFGHKRGAYSGAATDAKGKFQAADGGTVFLDEVADMPAPVQAKLLRVLESGEVFAVGSTSPTKVDVRLVAASNAPFSRLIEEKRLRRDVYFRLKTFRIMIPPLRERREEILPLFEFFMAREAEKHKKALRGISPKAMRLLVNYPWPGNVRELKNEAKRVALIMKGSGVVHGEMLNEEIRSGDRRGRFIGKALQDRMDCFERRIIEEALTESKGNKSQAAKILGVSRKGLNIKLKRLRME